MDNRGRFNSFKNYRKFLFYFSFVFLISLFIIGFFMLKPTLQGKAILNLEGNYQNNSFNGNVLLDLKDGELIPSESILIIENDGKSYEYSLDQVVKESLKEGNYYIENKNLNGSGYGYGFYGIKKEYPEVYFKFYVVKEDKENKNEIFGGGSLEEIIVLENQTSEIKANVSEEIIPETSSNETSLIELNSEFVSKVIPEVPNLEGVNEETIISETSEPVNSEAVSSIESSETISQPESQSEVTSESASELVSESTSEVSPSIITAFLGFIQRAFLGLSLTGRVSSEFGNEISESVKYGEEFKYKLNSNENIKIVSGSVKTDSKNLSENVLTIKIESGELIISTSYVEETFGFGKDYISEDQNKLSLDLASLNLSINEGNLKILINYGEEEISSFETIIQENQTIIIKEENETIIISEINISIEENETILLNETEIISNKILNLTSDELKILYEEFGNVSVKSSSKLFKDRIIVTFGLNSYESKYSYDFNLSDAVIQELMNRDRTNWLKDMAKTLSTEENKHESLNKFNESISLNQSE